MLLKSAFTVKLEKHRRVNNSSYLFYYYSLQTLGLRPVTSSSHDGAHNPANTAKVKSARYFSHTEMSCTEGGML